MLKNYALAILSGIVAVLSVLAMFFKSKVDRIEKATAIARETALLKANAARRGAEIRAKERLNAVDTSKRDHFSK